MLPIIGISFLSLRNPQDSITDQIIEPNPENQENNLNAFSHTTSSEGKISGSGLPGNVTLICNTSGNAGALTSNASFNVPIPTSWIAKYANITVTDVLKETDILVVEEDVTSNWADTVDEPYGMSFNITTTAVLDNVTVYWDSIWKNNGVTVRVYNATQQGAFPVPDTELYYESYPAPTEYTAWDDFIFTSPVLLDAQNTYTNAFFVVFNSSPDGPQGNLEWVYEDDGPGDDNGYAVEDLGSSWFIHPWDFTLRLGLRNNSRTPSDVDLKINGSSVIDTTRADGRWTSTFEFSNPTLNFQFSANYSAYFSVEYIISYSQTNSHVVTTTFEGLDSNQIIWNASYSAFFLADSFDPRLEFSLPAWKSATTVWKESSLHGLWNSSSDGSKRIVTITNAENGTWTVQCNDTNYVENVYAKRSGIIVSEVNGTDTIEIFGNFTETLTTGDSNLTIFPIEANYNDTTGESITNNKTIQFSPVWNLTETATGSFTNARLQVSWCNGTAVGIKSKNLTIDHIPTNLTLFSYPTSVDSGDSIFMVVNFTNEYTRAPVLGASLIVKNSSDGTVWPAPYQISKTFSNGTYKLEVLTVGVIGGAHSLSITLTKPLYLSSEISGINITIGGAISNISVTAPNCLGLDYINESYAVTNPAPYHNSSVKVSIFYYDNFTLDSLTSGIITASWIGGGPSVSWVTAFFGYYNITIDVTGFQSGTNHTLKILIQQAGYVPAELYVIVPIRKLPTSIESLEPSYSAYLEETISVYAVYLDTHNHKSIPSVYSLSGNCTIQIQSLVDKMTLLTPATGIYLYSFSPVSLGLEEGKSYNMTFSAYTSQHEFASVNVTLYVSPREEVNLTLECIPQYILAGTQFKICAKLTDMNGTPIINTPLDGKFIFQPGGLESSIIEYTNGSGIAEFIGDGNPLMQTVQRIVEYPGDVSFQNDSVFSSIIPITTLNSSLIFTYLPPSVQAGGKLNLSVNLLINGTPVVNETILFNFTYEGSSRTDIQSNQTDAGGNTNITLSVPLDVSKIYVNAFYAGRSYINASSISSQVLIDKLNSSLSFLSVPTEILAGTQFKIYVRLTDVNGTPIVNSPLTGRFIFQPGPLETSTVEYTNGSGIAEFIETANPLMQTMQIIVEYSGSINFQNDTISSSVIPLITLNSSLAFTYLPSTAQMGGNLDVNVSLLINGSSAVNEPTQFTFTYEGSDRTDLTSAQTDAGGTASTTLSVPFDVSKIYVDVFYGGSSYINASSINAEVAINKSDSFLSFLSVPSEILAGTQFTIYVGLTDINGTPITNKPLNGRFIFEPGALETSTVEYTNGSGIAEFIETANPLMKTMQIIIEFSGSVHFQNDTISSSVIPLITLNSSLAFTYLPSTVQINGTLDVNVNLLINGSFTVNETTQFTFTYEGSDRTDLKSAQTDAGGNASIMLSVPFGVSKIYVDVVYSGSSYINASSINSEVLVIKLNSILTLIPLPQEVQVGNTLGISAILLINGTPSSDKIITFTITDGSNVLDVKKAGTDSAGQATIDFQVPSGISGISVSASFDGISYVNGNSTSETSVAVITFMTLVVRYAPYWGAALAGAIVAILSYNFAYKRPRKQRRLKELQGLHTKFEDLHNLIYIMVVYKRNGIPIYEFQTRHTGSESLDPVVINPVLISGFLQAISSFQDQVYKRKGTTVGGWDLDYEKFKVSWFAADLIYFAVLSEERLSDITRDEIQNLITEFEETYQSALLDFDGDLRIFQSFTEIIKENLEVEIASPQIVNMQKVQSDQKVSKIETALLGLGMSIQDADEYFFLKKLLSTAASARGESQLELLGLLYGLWKRGYFSTTKIVKNQESQKDKPQQDDTKREKDNHSVSDTAN